VTGCCGSVPPVVNVHATRAGAIISIASRLSFLLARRQSGAATGCGARLGLWGGVRRRAVASACRCDAQQTHQRWNGKRFNEATGDVRGMNRHADEYRNGCAVTKLLW
jgi:hypothetical protein